MTNPVVKTLSSENLSTLLQTTTTTLNPNSIIPVTSTGQEEFLTTYTSESETPETTSMPMNPTTSLPMKNVFTRLYSLLTNPTTNPQINATNVTRSGMLFESDRLAHAQQHLVTILMTAILIILVYRFTKFVCKHCLQCFRVCKRWHKARTSASRVSDGLKSRDPFHASFVFHVYNTSNIEGMHIKFLNLSIPFQEVERNIQVYRPKLNSVFVQNGLLESRISFDFSERFLLVYGTKFLKLNASGIGTLRGSERNRFHRMIKEPNNLVWELYVVDETAECMPKHIYRFLDSSTHSRMIEILNNENKEEVSMHDRINLPYRSDSHAMVPITTSRVEYRNLKQDSVEVVTRDAFGVEMGTLSPEK